LAQCLALPDAASLVPLALPDLVRGDEHLLGTLCRDEQHAVVVGEDDDRGAGPGHRRAARGPAGAQHQLGRTVGAAGLAQGFATALREELDLRVEERNMTTVAAASGIGAASGVRIPVPCQPLCAQRVLVMERLDGRPLAAIDAGTPADVRAALARSLLDCVLREIMLEGTFHADPHPGNLLLLADGQLGLLDLGSAQKANTAAARIGRRAGCRAILKPAGH
jgi:hypothetical protein